MELHHLSKTKFPHSILTTCPLTSSVPYSRYRPG
jgi:hypothetical protein